MTATSRVLVTLHRGTFGKVETNEDSCHPGVLTGYWQSLGGSLFHDNRESSHKTDEQVRRLVTPGLRINGETRHIAYDVEDFPGTLCFPPTWTTVTGNRSLGKIQDHYAVYTGFVIIMGTDAMAYVGSALSFMLQHLNKPVIFTGAMIPIFYSSTESAVFSSWRLTRSRGTTMVAPNLLHRGKLSSTVYGF
ncbi:L-asparaginase-like [Haliotis rubra]|uniref:L-asparaginase-like n=1 Tax=Haliotis rubra TaxID=36100 RepID=UPI001EE5D427|nr:L-asparaginase-like [Haliotis rubra]